MKSIIVNHKEKNVEFVHFKKQHAVSTWKFNHEIDETLEDAKLHARNQMRIKLNESQE